MSEKKPYKTTASAGFFVAGQRVPSRFDEDGNRVPKVGHVLMLTDAEAKYELLQQSIEPASEVAEPAPLTPPAKESKKSGKAA
jgi:hypothetical protein